MIDEFLCMVAGYALGTDVYVNMVQGQQESSLCEIVNHNYRNSSEEQFWINHGIDRLTSETHRMMILVPRTMFFGSPNHIYCPILGQDFYPGRKV